MVDHARASFCVVGIRSGQLLGNRAHGPKFFTLEANTTSVLSKSSRGQLLFSVKYASRALGGSAAPASLWPRECFCSCA